MSSPERSEGCFIVLLVLFKREMKKRRPTALQPIQSLSYKTPRLCPHGPIYMAKRAHTRTHTHSATHTHTHICHVNPWDSPFQGGVDDGRAFSSWKRLVNPLCSVWCLTVCLESRPLLWQLDFGVRCFLGEGRNILMGRSPPPGTPVGQLCLLGLGQAGSTYGQRERERGSCCQLWKWCNYSCLHHVLSEVSLFNSGEKNTN